MNYKQRLTLLFVGLFFSVLASILFFIYVSYAEFRRDEFFERLRQKSFSTVKLLAEINEIDRDLLRIIDSNTINQMYDEKVLVFDERNRLIYSSLDDETIPYSVKLIDQIRNKEDKYYVDDDGDEVVGVHYKENGFDYVVLASAYDKYGINKLKNLRNLVIGALFAGTILIALSSYYYIRQVFHPIDLLNKSIQTINENNLREFVAVRKYRDELDVLAINYNQMLARLYKAFELQRSFVQNASHELKTPLALMQSKLEKLSEVSAHSEVQILVTSLMEDIHGQAALVESLLLMQRLQSELPIHKTSLRVDEVLDNTVKEVKESYPDLNVKMDIDEAISSDDQLTIIANPMLMKVCFKNMLENAALYSDNSDLSITLRPDEQSNLKVIFENAGDEKLPSQVFEPFYRIPKEQERVGSGLGLSIVRQIIETMQGKVTYEFVNQNHVFVLTIRHL